MANVVSLSQSFLCASPRLKSDVSLRVEFFSMDAPGSSSGHWATPITGGRAVEKESRPHRLTHHSKRSRARETFGHDPGPGPAITSFTAWGYQVFRPAVNPWEPGVRTRWSRWLKASSEVLGPSAGESTIRHRHAPRSPSDGYFPRSSLEVSSPYPSPIANANAAPNLNHGAGW